MSSSEDVLKGLIGLIQRTRDVELGCDEAYAVLDQHVEAVASGADAGALLPLVKHHLDLCPDCCEEYEALLRVIEAEL